MKMLLNAFKSPATWVLILSGSLGAVNALTPLFSLHPHVAEVLVIIGQVIGLILKQLEHQTALVTPPPQSLVEPPQTVVPSGQ